MARQEKRNREEVRARALPSNMQNEGFRRNGLDLQSDQTVNG